MKHNCKDCKERKVGCHATCESYQKFNAHRQAKRKENQERFEQTYNSLMFLRMSNRLTKQLGDWR